MENKSIYYKYCIVPLCKTTTIRTLNKIFIRLLYDSGRSKWLKACRRNEKDAISQKSVLLVCEDHFNAPTYIEIILTHMDSTFLCLLFIIYMLVSESFHLR